MILRADHPSYPDLIVPGSPFKNSGSSAIPATRAPSLGEHTDTVLERVLGYDSLRLSELRKRSII
jgi:crotonobetainyl-CoA:carnitine CoA-transferase CaiB-like acyl-CoA transferase